MEDWTAVGMTRAWVWEDPLKYSNVSTPSLCVVHNKRDASSDLLFKTSLPGSCLFGPQSTARPPDPDSVLLLVLLIKGPKSTALLCSCDVQ